MLSSLDIPSKIAETPWQDTSLRTFHQIDPEPDFQSQYHREYTAADPASSPLSLYPTNQDAQMQDEDRMVHQLTPSHIAPLVDLHIHFQDLPHFIHHPDFDHFAYCWMESQDHIELSKHVEYRPTVMAWFTSSSVQMATIASHYPPFVPNEDPEASTVHIKAAYQRLAHYFNVMRKVIDTIEQGRLANRFPQEVILPIFHHLFEKSISQQNQPNNIRSQPPIFYHHDELTYKSQMLPSFPGMSTSVPPSLNHSDASTPQAPPLSLEFPPNHQHLQSHEYLSMSNPATPNSIDTLSTLFWTYPVSMEQQQQPDQLSCMSSFDSLSTLPADTIKNEAEDESMPATTSMQLDPYPNYQTHILENPTPEDPDSDYQHTSMEEDNDDDDDDDDDYEEEDSYNSNNQQTKAKKKKKDAPPNDSSLTTTTATVNPHQTERQNHSMGSKGKTSATPRHNFPRRGRTATSYDNETTHFLKAMFFNIYSQRDKLTKDQRRQVVEKTGLKPRNVTYWFSNHKRRFQAALDVFKKLVAESNGRIQTYDDFVQWRRENGLPEDITDNRT